LLETAVVFCFLAILNATVQVLFVLLRKNREALGNHELEIREDGLLERSDVGESLHRWAGFHKVCSTRKHLFIFVTENLVHYVPMRSFSSSQEASRFRDEIKRRADAARIR